MPSLSTCNHFKILSNIIDSKANVLDVKILKKDLNTSPVPELTPITPKNQKPKWERTLPKKCIISAAGQSNSLKLKVEIETTDTLERKAINSLVDSRANGEFIDQEYTKSCRFNLQKLSCPIPVYNIDGSPNEAGSITEAVSLILRYKNHSEWTVFCITSLGKQKLILGHSWLWKHNPEIDWTKGEVKMSRCPPHCCLGCQDKLGQERITRKAEMKRIDICSIGPAPEVNHNLEDDSGLDNIDLEGEPLSIEEGDQILATGLLPPPVMEICALSTISQRLVKAFQTNMQAMTLVPEYLKEFMSVFSKQTFDTLPESKEWDHAIELIPGSKPSSCKIYLLSPAEQKELDTFLK